MLTKEVAMRKKLVYLILAAAMVLTAQLFPVAKAEANQCWWICCPDFSGCTRCCEEGPCPEPTCPLE
jgi:hypothetical protein